MSSTLVVPFGPLYGSMYISAIISTAFYGMFCTQTYVYFIHYQNDRLRLKSFVVLLWALNTTHQALIISGVYKYLKNGVESPLGFLYSIPELFLAVLPSIPVALFTQGFFVYRIYILSGKNVIAPIIWLPIALFEFVGNLLYVVKSVVVTPSGIQTVGIATLGDTFFKDITISYCTVAAGVDILISITIVILLTRSQNTTISKSTSKLLHRLTILAIVSGMWTALFALLCAILIIVYPSNLIWIVFSVPLCSLYSNTLLANLNARSYIRNQLSHHGTANIVASGRSGTLNASSRDAGEVLELTHRNNDMGIRKTTEVLSFSDTNECEKV